MSLIASLKDFSSHLGFRARSLDFADSQKAYSLAQLSRPELGITEWQNMIKWQRGDPPGDCVWIAIEDNRAYFHALFYCHLIHPSNGGKILRITDMIAADLPGPPVVASVVECSAFLAEKTGAIGLEFDLEGGSGETAAAGIFFHLTSNGWAAIPRTVMRFQPHLH